MRLYREVIMRSFQSHTTYRLEVVTQVVSSLFAILIQTSIWKAMYQGESHQMTSVGSISIQEMLTYSILSTCVYLLIGNSMIGTLGSKIGSGEIAMDLIKPVHLARYMFAESGGQTLFRILFEMLPIILFGVVAYGFMLPSVFDLMMFAICLFNGIILYYLMSFICGLFAFWYMVSWHTQSVFQLVMALCSGSLLPLWFFPEGFSRFVGFLPFQLVFYGPISVFLGKRTFPEELSILAMQGVWILLLGLILKWVWAKALRKLVIQGG
jgi:ABC-2 type transport system permease protein